MRINATAAHTFFRSLASLLRSQLRVPASGIHQQLNLKGPMYAALKPRLLAMCCLLGAVNCYSAPQWCNGTISNLFIDAAGAVYAAPSWRNDYVMFCNVNQNSGNVGPTTCIAWLSLLRSALQRVASVNVYYADAPACNAIPTYQYAPTPGYINLLN